MWKAHVRAQRFRKGDDLSHTAEDDVAVEDLGGWCMPRAAYQWKRLLRPQTS